MLHGVMRASHARSRTIPITYPSFSTTFGESKPRALGQSPLSNIALFDAARGEAELI